MASFKLRSSWADLLADTGLGLLRVLLSQCSGKSRNGMSQIITPAARTFPHHDPGCPPNTRASQAGPHQAPPSTEAPGAGLRSGPVERLLGAPLWGRPGSGGAPEPRGPFKEKEAHLSAKLTSSFLSGMGRGNQSAQEVIFCSIQSEPCTFVGHDYSLNAFGLNTAAGGILP